MRYFTLGPLHGTLHTRYAVLGGVGSTVIDVVVSRPDGTEVERPAHIRWKRPSVQEVRIKSWRINETPVNPAAGEQPRRVSWKRAGRRATAVESI